jgi:hypothetical protein
MTTMSTMMTDQERFGFIKEAHAMPVDAAIRRIGSGEHRNSSVFEAELL